MDYSHSTFHQAGSLAATRARLTHVARGQGIPLDHVEDIIQETLLEAWRHHDTLRSPEHYDAWLSGICRNLCLHYWRRKGREIATLSLSFPDDMLEATGNDVFEIDDLMSHQDLESLLERALGYLHAPSREALEICYLAEIPQPEAAARLGLSLSALEARLHRARKRLLAILRGPLRAEAEAFGLLLDDALPAGWRETREWCYFCGQRRLQGIFESIDSEKVGLRIRCPACSQAYGNLLNIQGEIDLRGLRSFRPALKRIWKAIGGYFSQSMERGGSTPCIVCGASTHMSIVAPEAAHFPSPVPLHAIESVCPRCGDGDGIAFSAYAMHPSVQSFLEQHPRWRIEPDRAMDYAGRPAIRTTLVDVPTSASLTIFADLSTARILSVAT